MSHGGCITGEEGLLRGAIRAGVRVVAGYPGSPSAAVLKGLIEVADRYGIYAEWAVNEKVALELCWGAAISGTRSLLCTKGVGLNVALDALMAMNLAGTRAGLVLLVGDDPSAYRSQNEQDSRLLGRFAELPLLEATRVEDACALMEGAFELSERARLPVLLREVRSFAVTERPVVLPPLPAPSAASPPSDLLADRRERRWIASTSNVVPRHAALHETLRRIAQEFEESPFNRRTPGGSTGILTAGFCAEKLDGVAEAMPLPGDLARLDLGTLHPLPTQLLQDFLAPLSRVLVIEEGGPYLETRTKAIAHEARLSVEVCGRDTGHFPHEGELLAEPIARGLASYLGVAPPEPARLTRFNAPPLTASKIPLVSEGLCPGCPYDPTFRALRDALEERGERAVVLADPGCAVRIMLPPLEMLDVKMAMGSCVGIGAGIARVNPDVRVIACPGDSGFFHSALAGLTNVAYNRVRMLVLVLDNQTSALSGCQPSPTTGITALGEHVPPLQLEEFARACRIDFVRTIDPANVTAMKEAFHGALAHEGVSLIVMRSPCILL